jgi:hypothetical protein
MTAYRAQIGIVSPPNVIRHNLDKLILLTQSRESSPSVEPSLCDISFSRVHTDLRQRN